MTSTYTPNLSLEKPGNGDYAGTWNVPVNADWDIVDTAIGGVTTFNVVGVSGTVVLTTAQYRARTIKITGALTANVTYQIPSGVGGFWFVYNTTTGAYTVTLSSGGGGTTVTLLQGYTTACLSDGTNIGLIDNNIPSAAGSNTQVQFNNNGLLGGSSSLTWGTLTANFIGSIAAGSNQLVVTGVTGTIYPTMVLGTITGGSFSSPTTVQISSQVSGTTGGAGTYSLSQTNTGVTGATVLTSSFNALSVPNIVGQTFTGSVTYASTVTGTSYAIGYLQIPQSTNTTAAASDVGKHLYVNSGVTINASVFSVGDSFVIVNSGSSSISINAGTGVSLRLAGSTTTSSYPVAFTNGSANITGTSLPAVGTVVRFTTGGSLPTNFSTGTNYYVKTNTSGTTITVSATSGGTAITAGSTGLGPWTMTTTRTLAGYGMASVLCVVGGATPTFMISGTGAT